MQILPLSLYIHLPWCIRKCPYCDFNSYAINGKSNIPEDDYILALERDLIQELETAEAVQGFDLSKRPIHSVFFGGGTPSLFSPKSIERILTLCQKYLNLNLNSNHEVEITLEANPGTYERHLFRDFRHAGINRLSLGVQSFNNTHLQKLGRIHTNQDTFRALEEIAQSNFNSFNLDIMYGLPNQSEEEALLDLKQAVQFDPGHLSWYQLTLEPNTVFHHAPPPLPSDESIFNMMEMGFGILREHGYHQYEVSAFSKPGFRAMHNVNYWEFGDYLGIGAGAHGKLSRVLENSFRVNDFENCENRESNQKNVFEIVRTQKTRYPKSYLDPEIFQKTEHRQILEKDLSFEFMLNALRLTDGFDVRLFESRTGLSIDHVMHKLEKGVSLGLVEWVNEGDALGEGALLGLEKRGMIVRPTTLGKRFLNDLVELFLDK